MGWLSTGPIPDPHAHSNPPNEKAKSLPFKLQPTGWKVDGNVALAGCEVMQRTIVQLSLKPQMSERRLNTICVVVERLGHHCGDDLVIGAGTCLPPENPPSCMTALVDTSRRLQKLCYADVYNIPAIG